MRLLELFDVAFGPRPITVVLARVVFTPKVGSSGILPSDAAHRNNPRNAIRKFRCWKGRAAFSLMICCILSRFNDISRVPSGRDRNSRLSPWSLRKDSRRFRRLRCVAGAKVLNGEVDGGEQSR